MRRISLIVAAHLVLFGLPLVAQDYYSCKFTSNKVVVEKVSTTTLVARKLAEAQCKEETKLFVDSSMCYDKGCKKIKK